MDPFVRRLVERLFDPSSGLSRNRHFHTFDNDEGRAAWKITKRLRALATDIDACHKDGGRPSISRSTSARGEVRVELHLERLKTKRSTRLEEAEFELLLKLPGVKDALDQR